MPKVTNDSQLHLIHQSNQVVRHTPIHWGCTLHQQHIETAPLCTSVYLRGGRYKRSITNGITASLRKHNCDHIETCDQLLSLKGQSDGGGGGMHPQHIRSDTLAVKD